MLVNEVLREVLAYLTRDDLDSTSFVSLQFRDVVDHVFADEPYRQIALLLIRGLDNYELQTLVGEKAVLCKDTSELGARLGTSVVKQLTFLLRPFEFLDDALIDALLPMKRAWTNAQCDVPDAYSSDNAFLRAYTELLFCDTLSINFWRQRSDSIVLSVYDPIAAYEGSFLTLPAVRNSRRLIVQTIPFELNEKDVSEWLHGSSVRDNPRHMRLMRQFVSPHVLVQLMKTSFLNAATMNPYVFEMSVFEEAVDIHDQLVNSDTEESLAVDTKNTDGTKVLQILRQHVKHK